MTPAQAELLDNLNALRRAVANTVVLRSILDDAWFDTVDKAIQNESPSHTIPADPTGFLYDFCHSLRGVDWFERDQKLALADRLIEVNEDGRFALAFAGFDLLKTMLPVIENRLAAFAALTFKPQIVKVKLSEVRAARMAPVKGDVRSKATFVQARQGA